MPATAVRLAFALWRFWQQRGYLDEARLRLDDMAARGWDLEPELRARLAETAGGVAYWQGGPGARGALVRRGARASDAPPPPSGDPEIRRELANALYNRGYVVRRRRHPEARTGAAARPRSAGHDGGGAGHLPRASVTRPARRTCCGASGATTCSMARAAEAEADFRRSLRAPPRRRPADDGSLVASTC